MKVTKAKEVLRRYRAGERNFSGLNLRGQSFKDANLSGADFSNTKLHSAKFTKATLIGVDFTDAKCGLQKREIACLFYGILCLILIFEFSLLICVDASLPILNFDNLIFLILFTAGTFFSIFQIIQKISQALSNDATITGQIFVIVAAAGAGNLIMILIAGLSESILSKSISQIEVLKLSLSGSLLGIILMGIAAITAILLLTGVLGIIGIIIIEIIVLALVYFWKGIPALLISFAVKIAANYAGWNSIKENGTQSWIRSFAISIFVSQGTSFYGADLTEAIFTKAKLKGAYFTKAILTRAYWKDAKMIDMAKFGETHLRNVSLRQLLISGDGKNQNFDRQDLRGVNLKDANLTDASFIDTDLSQANLQKTTLQSMAG